MCRCDMTCMLILGLAYAAYSTPISHKKLTQPYAHLGFAYANHFHMTSPQPNINREVFRVARVIRLTSLDCLSNLAESSATMQQCPSSSQLSLYSRSRPSCLPTAKLQATMK